LFVAYGFEPITSISCHSYHYAEPIYAITFLLCIVIDFGFFFLLKLFVIVVTGCVVLVKPMMTK